MIRKPSVGMKVQVLGFHRKVFGEIIDIQQNKTNSRVPKDYYIKVVDGSEERTICLQSTVYLKENKNGTSI